MKELRPEDITCALCGTSIQRVTWWQEPLDYRLVVIVECHGASERVEVPYSMLVEHEDIRYGRAFESAPQLPM